MRKQAETLPTAPVERPAQLRALASTVRQDIVDTVQALGSASVPELAKHLARAPDSLYYHVRALLKARLLVRLPEPQVRGGRREAVYATAQPDRRLKLAYRTGAGPATQALNALVGNMLRAAQREFETASADPGCVVDGPARELWAGRCKGWLSDAELRRANVLLNELATLLSSVRTEERTRLFSLQFLLAPARKRATAAQPPGTSPKPPTRASARRIPRRETP